MSMRTLATISLFVVFSAGCSEDGEGAGADPDGAAGAAGGMGGSGAASAGTGGAAATGGTIGAGGAGGTSGAGGAAGTGGSSDPSDAAVDGAAGASGDEYLPWAGGSAYYATWSAGPPSDPSFFPIAVWLQNPSRAAEYAAIGINLFIGLWQGPTEQQLSTLTTAGMPTFCAQSGVWASHLNDDTILAWTQDDEPDNAQSDGMGGYGPCIPASTVIDLYNTMKANDPTRPVYLNLGQGVANDSWVGRGVCTGTSDYPDYTRGADIVSFDVYPVNDGLPLWYVAQGVDRLRQWSNHEKPVWNWIETTGFNEPSGAPSPEQVRAEVWMSLVHGSMGIGYFVHVFAPSFIEAGLLADPTMRDAVAAINQQITELAPVLNTQSISNVVTVTSSNGAVPVDTMAKRAGGSLYVFAVGMRDGSTTASFALRGVDTGSVEVLGESRTLTVSGGSFQDDFSPYEVHLYRVSP